MSKAPKRAEKVVESSISERAYQSLLETAQGLHFLTNADNCFTYISPAFKTVLGRDPESLIGKNLSTIIHKDDWIGLQTQLTLLPCCDTHYQDVRLLHADGSSRSAKCAIKNELTNPDVKAFVWSAVDYTDLQQKTVELDGSRTNFKTVLDHSNDAICSVDTEGRLITFNSVLRDIFRTIFKVDLEVGMRLNDVVPSEEQAFWNPMYERAFRGERVSEERRYISPYGDEIIQFTLNPVFDGDRVVAISVFGRNVTTERRILDQIQFQANILSQTGDIILATDKEGKVTYWNPAAERQFGIYAKDVIGTIGRDIMPEWKPEESYEAIDSALAETGKWKGLFRLKSTDGTERVLSTSIYSLKENGQDTGRLSISYEITEQEKIQKALAESEAQYRKLFEESPLPMWIFSTETFKFLQVNRAACELYGFTKEEFADLNLLDIRLPEDHQEFYEESIQQIQNTGNEVSIIVRHKKKNGEPIYVQIFHHLVKYNNEVARFSLLEDVTRRMEVERELQIANDRYRLASEAVASVIYDVDLKTGHSDRTRGLLNLLGFEPQENGVDSIDWWFTRIHPDDAGNVRALLDKVLHSERSYEAEYRMQHKDGRYIYVWDRGVVARDESGTAIRIVGSTQDVTELVLSKNELQKSNERYRLASEAITSLIYDLDFETGYCERSSGLKTLLGFDPKESPEISTLEWWQQRIHPDDLDRANSAIENIPADQQICEAQYRVLHRDGHYIHVWDRCRISRDPIGKIVRLIGSTQDITAEVRAKQEIEEANERYRLASQAVTSVIYDWNLLTDECIVSPGMIDLLGFDPVQSPEIQRAEWWSQKIHPDDLPFVSQIVWDAIQDKAAYEVEFRMQHRDGHYVYVWDRGIIQRDPTGKAIRVVGSTQDVTEEIRIKKELQLANERFQLASEAVTSVIYDLDVTTGRSQRSSGLKLLLGFDQNENPEIGTIEWWHSRIHPEDVERVKGTVIRPDQRLYEAEYRMLHKDGHYISVWERGRIVRDKEGNIIRIIGSTQDVTAQIQDKLAIEQANERFVLASKAVTSVIYDWDLCTHSVVANGFFEMLGYSQEKTTVESAKWYHLESFADSEIHAEDRERVRDTIWSAINGDKTLYETEFRMQHRDGHYVYVWDRGIIQRNASGAAVRIVGSLQDITPRKRMEAQLEQERNLAILAKEKAEEMTRLKSSFLANMSHEIRTPMTAILGFSELLHERIKDPELAEHTAVIESSAKRLLVTINGILDLAQVESRSIKLSPVVTPINSEIRRICSLLEPLASQKQIKLTFTPSESSFEGFVDAKQLDHVVTNLIGNAIKFTDTGSVQVKVEGPFERETPIPLVPGFSSYSSGRTPVGEHFTITVEDTGFGIAPENLPLIFEEFKQESTGYHRSHEGTGLGLTISSRLTEAMGGSIEVRSARHVGSTFIVRLPIGDVPVSKADEKPKKKIVLVEDSLETVKLVTAILGQKYDVLHARSIADARGLFKELVPDLIFMDINLGEFTTGLDLTIELRQHKSFRNVPIIAITAYAMQADRKMALEAGCTDYIAKPFTRSQIVEIAQQYLVAQ